MNIKWIMGIAWILLLIIVIFLGWNQDILNKKTWNFEDQNSSILQKK